ncbi:YcxB family protein [Rossellomorea aquimaris]|uniref:YcxB family protein n=1 Tax=Rossellomorea aquimaris TaxID=189382 RepID=UPI0007D076D4|nr:YcxB family protein [Rossellomorea aquimaris]
MSNIDINTKRELSVRGTLTIKEYKKFSSFHTRGWIKWLVLSTFLLIFPFITYILYNPRDIFYFENMAAIFLVSSTVSVSISILFFLYAKLIIRIKATREYKSDQLIKNEFTYTFHENGINQKRGRSITYIEWNDIVSIREYPPMFLIYVSKNKAIVIPKRFFELSEEIMLFKKIMNENVASEKNKIT